MTVTYAEWLNEFLPSLSSLKRHEKLFLIQYLASDLAREETQLLQANMEYPVWSPYDAIGAADTLMNTLNQNDAA